MVIIKRHAWIFSRCRHGECRLTENRGKQHEVDKPFRRNRLQPAATTVTKTIARLLASIAVLALITGCVTTGPAKPPVNGTSGKSKGTGPTVQRLTDGREGFVVKEVAQLGEKERRTFARAVDLLGEEQYDQAIPLLEEVIAQSPNVTAPYIDLAIAYVRNNQSEKAEAQLKTALTLFPGHPVASNEYGLLVRKAGKFAEARAIYEASLEKFPEYSPLHRNLGILCDLYLNDLTCAMTHYEIYSENTPDDEQARMWIADLKIRMGN